MPDQDHFLRLLEAVSRVDERTIAIRDSQEEHQTMMRQWVLQQSAATDALADRVAAIEAAQAQAVAIEARLKSESRDKKVLWAKAGGLVSLIAGVVVAVLQQLGWLKQ